MKKENLLTVLILAGLVLGVLWGHFGLFDPGAAPEKVQQTIGGYQTAGDMLFIRPLRLLIIPLVFASVVVGVTSIGNPQRLGVIGGAAMGYFIGTTLVAVALGILVAGVVQPGSGVDREALQATAQTEFAAVESAATALAPGQAAAAGGTGLGSALLATARELLPTNIIKAAADGNVLSIVAFAIALGVALALVGQAAAPVVALAEGVLAALMKMVGWVMWVAPVGVFLIIAGRVGATGLANLVGPLGKYIVCVLLGLSVHMFLILPLVLWVFGRTNPYRFMWAMRKVIVTAFSTASSNATLPVVIEECRTVGGCSKRASTFVPALGATVNTNGTALYEAVAVLFLFQVFGIELTLAQKAVVLVTATLAAIGMPGIPGAGLVMMTIVINAVNTSLRSVAPDAPQLPLWTIGIIIGVDRFLDMCRTVLNVFGDCVGARIITRIAPDEPGEGARA